MKKPDDIKHFLYRIFIRICCVIFYFFVASIIVGFDFKVVFKFQEFFLVLLGTFLLTIVSKVRKECWKNKVARNALVSGIITGSLVLIAPYTPSTSQLLLVVFEKIRPIFYGIIISFIFFPFKDEYSHDKIKKSGLLTGDQFRDAGLSRRESEIAHLAVTGLTNSEIAESLFISPTTVKTHMSNILEKLNMKSRKDLCDIISAEKKVPSGKEET